MKYYRTICGDGLAKVTNIVSATAITELKVFHPEVFVK